MYYEQKNSILDVPDNSEETSLTLKGNNGPLGGLMRDLVSIQITTFSAYMPTMTEECITSIWCFEIV